MFMPSIRRVAIGLSGGVDSTVSALLLKRKGFEVVGVFMKNWDVVDETGVCTSDADAEEAENVCKRLDIPFRHVNFVKEYWNEVFEDLLKEYRAGFTPNPDILCNRNIKFEHFQKHCLENIGCDAVATGHYARTSFGEYLERSDPNKNVKLLKAVDRIKDQTFFLSQVSQEGFRRAIFPVGELTKDVVKKIATSAGFEHIAEKKESMGICFIGKRKNGFQDFVDEYIAPSPGEFIDIDTGKCIGQHKGIHQWTLGQNIRVPGLEAKYYVVDKDVKTQTIRVCQGRDHPSLYAENFFTGPPHWIGHQPDELRHGEKLLYCDYRFQNTHQPSPVVVSIGMSSTANWEFMDQGSLIVSTASPQRALTPGQYAVFYSGDECLGSARIERVGPSMYTMNTNKCRDNIMKAIEEKNSQK